QDPDEGEILYCYTNAGTDAEYIPAVGGSNVIEKTIDCIVVIGTASNVSATIDDSLVFTRESEFNAKFDASGGHKHTGAAGDGPKLTSASYAGGSVTDAAMGTRTADPTTATAYGLVGSITQWFSWITKYFKAITGKANPFDPPDITLAATKTHVDDTTRHITAAERTAWNTMPGTADAKYIPKTDRNVANGVTALDANRMAVSDGNVLSSRISERVLGFSFSNSVANQRIDLYTTGALSGYIEVSVTASWNAVNAAGKMTKRFNVVAAAATTLNYQSTQYPEVTGLINQHISISDISWDATNSRWKISIEARHAPGAAIAFAVSVKHASPTAPPTWNLSAVYSGAAPTALPVAVQTIPDDTVLQSGQEFQKYKLTDNSGKVIRLAPSTDLNTVNRNGQYDGYPLVNAPGNNTTAWFFIEVFSHSQNPDTILFQRATTFATVPRSYIRECYNSVWGEWIEEENASRKNVANGYLGLDATALVPDARLSPNISRLATRLVTDTNLNDVIGEGTYHCDSNAVAGTILNIPPAIANLAFGLRVTKTAGAVGFNQDIYCYSLAGTTSPKRYTRNYYNGTWSSWQEIETTASKGVANGYAGLDSAARVPRINTYNEFAGYSTVTDFNAALTAGVYSVSNTALNSPVGDYGHVEIIINNKEVHDNVGNWIWQKFYATGGGTYVRRKLNERAWDPWVPAWSGYNDSPIFMTRALLANNTDLNKVITNGIWNIYQPTGITNAPPVTYGLMSVYRADSTTNYIKQEIIDIIPGTIYTRSRNGGTAWSPWVTTITSAGGNFTGAVSRTYGGSSVKYNNVASYYYGGANNTGTLKITLPVSWNNAMMNIKITGFDYSTRGSWELSLGCYNFSTGWSMLSASVVSYSGTSLPFSSIRFAHDGSKCCILLGNTATIWQYPSIEITEVLASHNGATGLGGDWTMSVITSETGISGALSTPITWGNADSVGGYSAAQVTQGTLAYAVTSGTAPTLAATFNPAVPALTAGLRVTIKAHAATTGPVTLNVNGLGAKSIKKPNGNNPPLALGGVYTVVYDGTAFILQGEGGEYGTATAAEVLAGKTIGTDNGLVNGTMPDRTRAGDSLTYTTALSAKGDGLGSLVMEPQTGYYASGLNSGGFGTLLSVDPNFVPSSILSTRSIFGVQGSIPVITSGDDVAIGVGRWPNGDLAGYPREGYRKGGAGAGELKVTVGQLQSIGYRQYASGRSSKTGGAVNIQYTDGTSYAQDMGNVTGLWFTPRIITAVYTNSQGQKTVTTYIASIGEVVMSSYDTARCKRALLSQNPGIVVNSSGFTMPVFPYNLFGADFEWEAWG
ncbi:hypothetical protein BSK60_32810, partial [Paenibacillus odorifer]